MLWFLLAMGASALLLAVTNHMLRNIAAIPLLWVAPLSLYLLSYHLIRQSAGIIPLWYALFMVAG